MLFSQDLCKSIFSYSWELSKGFILLQNRPLLFITMANRERIQLLSWTASLKCHFRLESCSQSCSLWCLRNRKVETWFLPLTTGDADTLPPCNAVESANTQLLHCRAGLLWYMCKFKWFHSNVPLLDLVCTSITLDPFFSCGELFFKDTIVCSVSNCATLNSFLYYLQTSLCISEPQSSWNSNL